MIYRSTPRHEVRLRALGVHVSDLDDGSSAWAFHGDDWRFEVTVA